MKFSQDTRIRSVALRLFWPALALFIIVLPVQHTIGLRYLALAGLFVATAGIVVSDRKSLWFPLSAPWILYAGAALLSLPFALEFGYSLRELRTEIVYCFLLFALAASASSSVPVIRGLTLIILVANAIYVTSALFLLKADGSMDQIYNLPPLAFAGVNANLLVTFIPLATYAMAISWVRGRRIASLALAVLLLMDAYALVLGYNRQSWVALGTGLLCGGGLLLVRHFTWLRFAALLFAIASVAALFSLQLERRAPEASGGTLVKTTVSQDPRWKLWGLAFQGIAERPWTGYGFGRNTFALRFPEIKAVSNNYWHAHNMVLNKGVQMGIPGMLAFLILWITLAREFTRHLGSSDFRRRGLAIAALSTLAMVFTKNMTDDFFVRDIAMLFWLLMGAYVGTLRTGAEQNVRPD